MSVFDPNSEQTMMSVDGGGSGDEEPLLLELEGGGHEIWNCGC